MQTAKHEPSFTFTWTSLSQTNTFWLIFWFPTTQQRSFYGPLSGTTQVSRYQKKHSPIHHPDHHPIFISFFHLPQSIASSLFKLQAWQSFCTTSLHVLFGLPLGLEPSTLYSIHFNHLLDFYGAREDNRSRYTNSSAGRPPCELVSDPIPSSPHFYARCPSCCNHPNLSWLGTGTGTCWIANPHGLVPTWLVY